MFEIVRKRSRAMTSAYAEHFNHDDLRQGAEEKRQVEQRFRSQTTLQPPKRVEEKATLADVIFDVRRKRRAALLSRQRPQWDQPDTER